MRRTLLTGLAALGGLALSPFSRVQAQRAAPQPAAGAQTGNVIFFHPDGMGLNHWGAVRMHTVGPDGRLNWDRLPAMAVYLGHMQDGLASTSNAGATTHAYGVKVNGNAFAMHEGQRIRPLSGGEGSIAHEALARGKWVGLVNSGSVEEPGTACFIASAQRRSNYDFITQMLVESGIQVHMAGGERYYLPRGVRGRHGEGVRGDSRNLVQELRDKGYTVVFTREELLNLPPTATRVWGIFAERHTFNDRPEETLAQGNLPLYAPNAPSIAEMAEAALRILSRAPQGFLLVAEEEGTDNFANANNAAGQLEAGRRADEAVGVFARYVQANPRTLMLMTSDSDAGGMQLLGPGLTDRRRIREGQALPERDNNGAPWDGQGGSRGMAFMSAPDRNGTRHPFAITWATADDAAGGVLARAVGLNSNLVSGTIDNTDIYRVMYRTLFGVTLS
ncbi:alkaline phosphatase [Falsiroseomonas oryzae]|uniref:alkaline phosphatase n=1 Tax=Falsiroseomonas oryzae TaxID=2766473 RepID=UPI0022EA4C64|nr:alkaline phosphatase [Roseomonas sp. MO-31]